MTKSYANHIVILTSVVRLSKAAGNKSDGHAFEPCGWTPTVRCALLVNQTK